jgi:hypothetical protein
MGKNSDSGFWGCFGALIGLVIVGAMGYGLYWLITPTDYVGKIESAIEKRDFSKANSLLRDMKEDNRYKPNFLTDAEYPVYLATYNKVIQAEITFLINENDQQSSDRLIGLIIEYPINSNPATGTTHDSDIIEGNDNYNAEVGKFNDYCNQILSRAINTGNQYLADAIINTYKPTLARKKVDTHLFGSDEYDYQYVETDKEKAKTILKEAIKDKKFN